MPKGCQLTPFPRLKERWIDEHREWRQRDLSDKRYVYLWVDGIYSNVRLDDRLCLLVVMGVTEHGRKELVAVEEGYRESEASWLELLNGLVARGLTSCPKLATADGALGFAKPEQGLSANQTATLLVQNGQRAQQITQSSTA
ncbi:hypothetical protein OURE66S_00414 [Oligella ureolytica]